MSAKRVFGYVGAAGAGLVAVLALILGLAGAFHHTSQNTVAAAMGLVGVVVTASVALLGQIVGRQSERRLRLEAAVHAGAVMMDVDGRRPSNASIASGLLALTGLDRADLAVALLVDLWSDPDGVVHDEPVMFHPNAEVSELPRRQASGFPSEIAVQVIDAALRSNSENAQLIAAELLCRNSYRLDIRQSLHWPSAVDGRWNARLNNKTKLLVVDALVRMALTSTPDIFALQSLAVRLYGIADGDPDNHVKGCLGILLAAILPRLEGVGTLMQGPREVTIEQLRGAASQARPNPNRSMARVVKERSDALGLWANNCQDIDYRPGALAAAGGR